MNEWMNKGIHLDLNTWVVPGQVRKANLFTIIIIIIVIIIIISVSSSIQVSAYGYTERIMISFSVQEMLADRCTW